MEEKSFKHLTDNNVLENIDKYIEMTSNIFRLLLSDCLKKMLEIKRYKNKKIFKDKLLADSFCNRIGKEIIIYMINHGFKKDEKLYISKIIAIIYFLMQKYKPFYFSTTDDSNFYANDIMTQVIIKYIIKDNKHYKIYRNIVANKDKMDRIHNLLISSQATANTICLIFDIYFKEHSS